MHSRLHGSGMLLVTGLDELRKSPGYWYLASPYTKFVDGVDAAYLLVADISDELHRARVRHFCPIRVSHDICERSGIDKIDHNFWMSVDRPFMTGAAGLLVAGMEGWEESRGIIAERAYFGAAKKPMMFLDPAILLGSEI